MYRCVDVEATAAMEAHVSNRVNLSGRVIDVGLNSYRNTGRQWQLFLLKECLEVSPQQPQEASPLQFISGREMQARLLHHQRYDIQLWATTT